MTKVTETKLGGLRAIPYLAGVPRDELLVLSTQCRLRDVAKGATIFAEGEPAERLFVVLRGRLKLLRTAPRGREQVLHTEGPGSALGEAPLFDGGGYVASAVAVDEARLLFVPRAAVFDLCRRHPEVALGIIGVLARRVRAFAALAEDLALHDVMTRLARYLFVEADRQGGRELQLAATRDEIGAMLGTVRELVSRSLSRLRASGVIEISGRRVRVRDARRLAELAGLTEGG